VTRRRPERRQRGQSLIEFALALPIFLVLLLGVLDFGRLLFTYVSLTNSAREMARVLAVPATSNSAAIAAFTNPATILGATNAATDLVTVNVYDSSGALQGSQTGACSLPLSTANCTVPARAASSEGGWLDVSVSYTFRYVPLFRAPFGVSFLNPSTVITTAARAYIE
jgi:Flp pilus assembly protein TadG